MKGLLLNKVVVDPPSPKITYAKQLAAVPCRRGATGEVEVLLVTSRISRHWLLPKGWPMVGKTLQEAAAQEAFEEAGVIGKMRRSPAGRYHYKKLMKDGTVVPCVVVCYPLRVSKELTEWPEAGQRLRQWFLLKDAAAAVFEPALAQLLADPAFAEKLGLARA